MVLLLFLFTAESFLLEFDGWDEARHAEVDNVELNVVAIDVVVIVSEIVASGAMLSLRFVWGSPDPLSALSAETLLRRNEAIGSGSYSANYKNTNILRSLSCLLNLQILFNMFKLTMTVIYFETYRHADSLGEVDELSSFLLVVRHHHPKWLEPYHSSPAKGHPMCR